MVPLNQGMEDLNAQRSLKLCILYNV